MRHGQARTDFSQYSHQQLAAMLAAADPATVRSVAASWDGTGRLLHDQAATLQQKLAGFQDEWQGQAATQYRRMITDLANGLQTVGDTAWAVRDAAYDAADALDAARAQMPAPQAVPELPPATVALATAPPSFDGLTQPQASQLIQQHTAAVTAVQSQQQAQTAADGAHAQAVQVMTTLADHYVADDNAIPDVPDAGTSPADSGTGDSLMSPDGVTPPAVPQGVVPQGIAPAGGGTAMWSGTALTGADPLTGGTAPGDPSLVTAAAGGPDSAAVPVPTNPVFGNMFRDGIAAASGAFPLTRVPSLIRRRDRDKSATDPAAAAGAAAAARAAATAGAKLPAGLGSAGLGGGGIGSPGGGFSGGIGGAGGATPTPSLGAAPSAYTGLAGSGAAPGAGSVAGLGGTVGGAATGTSAGGFMGGMPMGAGMGGMGMDGGGRRIPPWLVETEDVWGESSAVSPTVIGEEL